VSRENVHGLDPVAAGVRLLPMTATLIIGSPISGKLIGRLGPRTPMVAGMVMTAVALFGLSRLTSASDLNETIAWFVLLGLGLSPVMVGATDVIAGNDPVELAGVASGLQSTALQLGGAIGSPVLGAVLAAKISSLLPGAWHAAHLPPLTATQLAGVKSAVQVGAAPMTRSTPPQASHVITQLSHATFAAGMHTAFLVAAAIALAGAVLALVIRRGNGTAAAHPASRVAPAA
jgi:predicted MFS family arabinose efflux permease